MISSADSPRFRYFSRLKKKKERAAKDLFIVEGVHLVELGLKAGLIDRVIYSSRINASIEGRRLLKDITSTGIPADEASDSLLKEISSVETHQGILATARPKDTDIGELFKTTAPLILIACGIQDPGNLGTMIRTADAAGCSGIIVTSRTVDPYNDKVVRSTAGSIFHLNIVKYDDIIGLVPALKRRGIRVIATEAGTENIYFNADLTGAVAVIVGNEGRGLSDDVVRVCDGTVSIPMADAAESLNAAVSAALVVYESVRQRMSNAG